jgi:DNA mismatch endonuclease (patch repair protein)
MKNLAHSASLQASEKSAPSKPEIKQLDPERRSALMARIRGKNTKPELVVRRLIHGLGYRYRLHRRDLPGTPDLIFPRYRAAVFVHGCFWHGHQGCRRATLPATRTEYWNAKIERNKARDWRAVAELEAAGWRVLTVLECSLIDTSALSQMLRLSLPPRLLAAPRPGRLLGERSRLKSSKNLSPHRICTHEPSPRLHRAVPLPPRRTP